MEFFEGKVFNCLIVFFTIPFFTNPNKGGCVAVAFFDPAVYTVVADV
ncbi:MAG: hypothetical protein ACTSYI_03215 [Promethearchaeota archaeon]